MPVSARKRAPQYGSYVEAASLARVSTDTIKRWVKSGKVSAKRDGASSRVLVSLDDINKLIDDAANVPAS
jgi:excisionase family DNA binding protein